MSCVDLRSFWETFLDGELPARQMLELQAHLDGCSDCSLALAFSQALRSSTRSVVENASTVSEAFRSRLEHALTEEARAEREEQNGLRTRRLLRHWVPRAGILTASAAAVMVLWTRLEDPIDVTEPVASDHREQRASMLGSEELLDRLIDYHSSPPEPQVTRPELVPQLEQAVGVRLPTPSLAQYGALWQGGSVVRVRWDQPAAYLRYRTVDDHKVTVYVYNAARMPLHAGLQPRMFREEQMYEGYRRGYTIVAQLRRGVGYAVATDLDEPISAELVRAISNSAVTH